MTIFRIFNTKRWLNFQIKRQFGITSLDGSLILKFIAKLQVDTIWSGLIYFRTGPMSGFFSHNNYLPVSIKGRNLFFTNRGNISISRRTNSLGVN
jgi:hypothetical protein